MDHGGPRCWPRERDGEHRGAGTRTDTDDAFHPGEFLHVIVSFSWDLCLGGLASLFPGRGGREVSQFGRQYTHVFSSTASLGGYHSLKLNVYLGSSSLMLARDSICCWHSSFNISTSIRDVEIFESQRF